MCPNVISLGRPGAAGHPRVAWTAWSERPLWAKGGHKALTNEETFIF